MARLMRRAEAVAQVRQRATVERMTREMRERGVNAASERGAVVLTCKGLLRRWLGDPALRFVGRTTA